MSRLAVTAASLVPATAWAHPGHGTLDPTAVRGGVLVLVAVVAAVAAWGWSKARATRAK
jgi:hypothetical protein